MKAARLSLCVNIGHTPVLCDAPALDGVQVIDRAEWTVGATDCDQLRERWLDIAGFISAPALQDRGLAVPNPRKAEADRTYRLPTVSIRAGIQVFPASTETSTDCTRPRPDQARPVTL